MKGKLIIILAAAIFISGCTSSTFFGQDVLKITETSQPEGIKDTMAIHSIETIPHSPVLPDRDMLLSFIIENKDTKETAKEAAVSLYDAASFYDGGKPCSSDSCKPIDYQNGIIGEVLPGEQKMITYALVSPTEKDIVKVKADLSLNFKVKYDFKASTLYRIPLVNEEEIKTRQRAGESVSIDVPKFISSGPVQIDIDLGGPSYILSGKNAVFIVKIRHVGDKMKGSLENSKIEKDKIEIIFPSELGDVKPPDKIFTCNKNGNNNNCKNNGEKGEIELFRGESTPYRFEIGKTKALGSDIPYQSFDIRAEAAYTYELRDSAKVTIKPYEPV